LPPKLYFLKLGWKIKNKVIFPKSLKELSLSHTNILINNIPNHIEKVFIKFYHNDKPYKKVENLPLTIKEIVIKKEIYKKYIKIPFGCKLTIKKINECQIRKK
jgi:hypothetical protein